MFGLADLDEVTHLAAEPGSGATTMLLQLSRSSLQDGGRVLWLSRTMPDGLRMTQIFSNIDPTAVARFHAGSFGEALDRGILNGIKLVRSLSSLNLVLVDDWSGNTGQPSKIVNNAVKNLIEVCRAEKTCVVLSSSMYGDASGDSLWKVRGQRLMTEIGVTEWKLFRGDGMRRSIEINKQITELILTDNGFGER